MFEFVEKVWAAVTAEQCQKQMESLPSHMKMKTMEKGLISALQFKSFMCLPRQMCLWLYQALK